MVDRVKVRKTLEEKPHRRPLLINMHALSQKSETQFSKPDGKNILTFSKFYQLYYNHLHFTLYTMEFTTHTSYIPHTTYNNTMHNAKTQRKTQCICVDFSYGPFIFFSTIIDPIPHPPILLYFSYTIIHNHTIQYPIPISNLTFIRCLCMSVSVVVWSY